MAINKSATHIGTLVWRNGNQLDLWIGANSNTGTTIVWQRVTYLNGTKGRSTRFTGRNVTGFADELNRALNEGELCWSLLGANPDALEALSQHRSKD